MLLDFLKISILFLSLWIHGLKAGGATYRCNESLTRFSSNSNSAVCQVDGKTHNCKFDSCFNHNNHWVLVTGCRQVGTTDGLSNQQCAQYSNAPPFGYKCTNPGGVSYYCPNWNPKSGGALTCSNCTPS
ncbi:uncharacterized protein MELLADRAFT_123787 [Melampsora larici-populina 98AG31]|uniref:Secreted protein n=1 Tax=Melampsora larici-populina (strain 98AG31 / pathotype 3-4-7) TaxID=747676 RepID=F4R9M6_MELLP|nr:uncharacterized protein MELLADRAFT_123787 [Melampsora larici-populina 98AG31]EGG11007.1 secreted protein [Melampsora larici-populina 98AG31]